MHVLVRTPNWLGDIVMALPVFAALRAHFAGDLLAAGVPRAFAPLLSAVPAVDQVVPLHRAGRRGWRALDAEADALRRGGFDLAVLLPNSFGSAWAAWRAGIPERWGFAAQWRRGLLTRAVPRPGRRTPPLHQVDYYQELVRGLDIDSAAAEPRLAPPPRLIGCARSLLDAAGWDQKRPIVGIAPGAAYGYAKRWMPDRYGRVADRLSRALGAAVVLRGRAPARRSSRGSRRCPIQAQWCPQPATQPGGLFLPQPFPLYARQAARDDQPTNGHDPVYGFLRGSRL